VIHLDTSFLIDFLREQSHGTPGPATAWLNQESSTPLGASLFVHCELFAGAAGAAHPAREQERIRGLLASIALVLPSDSFAERYGATLIHVQRASRSISTMDLLIATAALEDRAPLVTANRRHFSVVPDLEILSHR
jgi:predicted nucleic acid-binding protein